jgi:hypothetical protein
VVSKDAVDALERGSKDDNELVRVYSLHALWKLDYHVENLVPSFVDLLASNDDAVVGYTLDALEEMGSDGHSAAPALLELSKRRPSFRDRVRTVLGATGGLSESR